MINIEYDDEDMLETARVIRAVNPHAHTMTVAQIVDHMKYTADGVFNQRRKTEYVSTLGYVLTLYKADKNTFMIKPSVSAFTVESFLKERGMLGE